MKKQTSLMRERAICIAIEAVSWQFNEDANAQLVIGIHELLRVPLRIEIPTRSIRTRELIKNSARAIQETLHHERVSRGLGVSAFVA